MKLWACILFGLVLSTAIDSTVAAPRSVTHVLQNDFTAVCVVDSVLIAAGNNSMYTATFDPNKRQFEPADIADHAGPAKIIKRQGDLVVIESASGVLTILSAVAIPQIQTLDLVPPPLPYSDFTILNGQLFLACGFDGLRQYQLSGNGTVTLLDSSLAPVHAVAVTSSADHIYVADDYTGIVVFEPSESSLGTPTAVVPLANPITSIAARNDTVFTGSGSTGISLWHALGDSVILLSELPTHTSSVLIELADTLVLSVSPDGRSGDLVSLAGHTNPLAIQSSEQFLGGSAFVSGDDILFVAPTTDGDFSLYDLGRFESGGALPRPANTNGGSISDVGISGSQLIITRTTLPSIAFALAEQVAQSGSLIFPGLGGMAQVERADGHILFYSREDQVVYVGSEAGGGIQLDTTIILHDSTFESIRVSGLVHDSNRVLSVFAPGSIELYRLGPDWRVSGFARLYLPEEPIDMVAIDTLLAVGCHANVYLYSISDDLFLSYRSTIGVTSEAGQLVRLLSDPSQSTNLSVVHGGGVSNYDLSAPNSPSATGQLEISGGIVEAAQSGDYLFLATIDDGFLKVHAPASTDPVVVDSVRLVGNKLAVAGSTIALASDHGLWLVDWSQGSDIDEDSYAGLPLGFRLEQNFPNPFNPVTNISYELSKPGRIELTVYNILGQPVHSIVEATQTVGTHTAVFDGRTLASGVYIYRLTTPGGAQSRKMVLVK